MNDKNMTLIYRLILVCQFEIEQDPSVILPMRTAICNPKWPTLKNITFDMILNEEDRTHFESSH